MAIFEFEKESYEGAKEIMAKIKAVYENPRSRKNNNIDYVDLTFLNGIYPNKVIDLGNGFYYLSFMNEAVYAQIADSMHVVLYSREEFQNQVTEKEYTRALKDILYYWTSSSINFFRDRGTDFKHV